MIVSSEAERKRAMTVVAHHATPFIVTIKKGGSRSLAQNRYLWGVCYPTILEQGGEEMSGWTSNDLHEFFLIDHFGHEVVEGFGRKRMRPIKRSSVLTKMEFVDYVAHIQQFMAERGVYIPDPQEQMQ